jgi:hypothetical protein
MKKVPTGYELIDGRVLKKCHPSQIRNPITKRCNKAKPIPRGYELINGKLLKQCRSDQIRNPKTGRCIKRTSIKDIKQAIKIPKIRSPPKSIARSSRSPPKVDCKSIKILNENNSCYLDSLLVSLFHKKNPHIFNILFKSPITNTDNSIIKQKAQEIRNELQEIYLLISGIKHSNRHKYCKNLRKLLNDYKKLYTRAYPNRPLDNNDWQRDQSEPMQTLQYLNTMFDFPLTTKRIFKRWGTNDKLTKDSLKSILDTKPMTLEERNEIFITTIDKGDLFEKDKVFIKNLYPSKISISRFDKNNLWQAQPNKFYKTKIEKVSYVDAPFLFLHVDRLIIDPDTKYVEKMHTAVIPDEYVKTKTGRLELQSIIVHVGAENGGHYICLIKCDNNWYEYDDLSKKTQFVGSLQDVISYNRHMYIRNNTDLVYF